MKPKKEQNKQGGCNSCGLACTASSLGLGSHSYTDSRRNSLKFLIGVHKMKSIVSCFYTDFVTHSKVPVIARNSMPVGEMGIKNKRKGHPGNLYI